MSLSSDPTFSVLKKYFVCGYRDISNESYAGVSGSHEVGGKAVDTTNGAGPHNLQLFIMTADGVILTVLPGYWHSEDIIPEMNLAAQLQSVWLDQKLSRGQKNEMFRRMHLAHSSTHAPETVRRSRMQGFDMQYEVQNRLASSDTIVDRHLAKANYKGNKRLFASAFKTTDQIMHERMANHPFESYTQFDVAAFADYGKPKYDKHEDYRNADGQVDKIAARNAPKLGNADVMKPERPKRMRGKMSIPNRLPRMVQKAAQRTLWGTGRGWGS